MLTAHDLCTHTEGDLHNTGQAAHRLRTVLALLAHSMLVAMPAVLLVLLRLRPRKGWTRTLATDQNLFQHVLIEAMSVQTDGTIWSSLAHEAVEC